MWVKRISALVTLCVAQWSQAAAINYGNFVVPAAGVGFQQVTESSGTDPVPLYGPPAPYAVGLDFDPVGFTATSSGGAADITDGQLNFTVNGVVTPTGGVGINGISLFEAGDYTLAGAGGAATGVSSGAIIRVTVTEIDGVPVAPISLTPVNASFSDALPPAMIVAPWSLGLFLDIDAQLTAQGKNPVYGATKLDVVINNSLVATSELSSVSFIAKKEFRIDVLSEISGTIPEPAFVGAASLAMLLLGRRRAA